MQMTSIFFWGMERAPVTHYLLGADQKIPGWQDYILEEVQTAVSLGSKPWFGDLAQHKWLALGPVASF